MPPYASDYPMAKLVDMSNSFRLKPLEVSGYPSPIDPDNDRIALGRSPENDVVLTGGEFPSVSGQHAVVERRGGKLTVHDAGSRNGTYVNNRRIDTSRELSAGDVVQLGAIGPKFVVISASPLSETMFVDPKTVGLRETEEALSETRVHQLVEIKSRRNLVALSLLAVLGTVAVVMWGNHLSDQDRAGEERLAEQLTESRREREEQFATLQLRAAALESSTRKRERQIQQERVSYERRLAEVEREKSAIEESRQVLQARFDKLEADGSASSELLANMQLELADTRQVLEDAQRNFELLDPVNLEQNRLAGVSRVRTAIVLIEIDIKLRHRETGKFLYMSEQRGVDIPNLDDMGEPWSVTSTGSGFCVSEEGWILTNAHVVSPSDAEVMLEAAEELDLDPIVEINAVFSGNSVRHRVEVVRLADAPGEDLALIKIEPFEGLPFIDGFSLERPAPNPGSDVYLFGFPLGNFALQQGETVIASTFRGILSRNVGGRMQVDAGVHPGNSGGPVTDAEGRVIGVVYSVQALPDQSAVYTIGYAIPIADALQVWPPPENWRSSLVESIPAEPIEPDWVEMIGEEDAVTTEGAGEPAALTPPPDDH